MQSAIARNGFYMMLHEGSTVEVTTTGTPAWPECPRLRRQKEESRSKGSNGPFPAIGRKGFLNELQRIIGLYMTL